MSSGQFTNTFYQGDDGETYNIRVQPETLTLSIGGTANDAPSGPATADQQVKVSASRNEFGVKARKIRVRVTSAGTSGLTVGGVISLPWLDPNTFVDVTRPGRQTGTYRDGAAVEVVGGTGESFTG